MSKTVSEVRVYHYLLLKKPGTYGAVITIVDLEGNVVSQSTYNHPKTDFNTAAESSIRDMLSRCRKLKAKIVSFHTNTRQVLTEEDYEQTEAE